jgi:uncharacterized membrane protein
MHGEFRNKTAVRREGSSGSTVSCKSPRNLTPPEWSLSGHLSPMPEITPPRRRRLTSKFHWRNSGQYFLRGVLVISPVLITVSVLVWGFKKVDGILNPYVTRPGLGFASVLLFILLTGWISTFYFVKRISRLLGNWIEHTPGVSFIYTSVRDFFEAFVGNKRRFSQAVLVDVFADEVWVVGFLTDEDPSSFNLGTKHVSVYVPQAYNVGGQLYLLKRERVRLIENLAPSDVMKYAVTGGAVEITEIDA